MHEQQHLQHDNSDVDHANMSNAEHSEQIEAEAVAVVEQASPEMQQHIQQLTESYLSIKNALVKGDAAAAKTAAEKLLARLNSFNAGKLSQEQQTAYSAKASELKEDAEHIIGTGAVSHQRDHFATLSKRIYELNKAFEANSSTLYYQYCPMAFNNKGGYWLSAEQEIRNPYFSDKMLKCGRITETL
ncbi:hypothetical protein ADICEAN_02138 [Cesiribacter andamanensis AMV16]|uniref:DUF3347 domain-containing protein n=2 Tax=Cesiribacter TaxID=1133570 RepID=M7N658_9BACT|nr:hypothetical protein ADICEAN_02138 [Cesiribacter andamanensis AMV16]